MNGTTKALRENNVSQAVRFCEAAIDMAGHFESDDTRLSQSQVLRAEVYLWEKKNDLAEKTFKLAIATCEKATGSNDIVMTHPLSSLANYYHFVARRDKLAVPLLERILQITENSTNRTDRDVIMWSRNLGILYQQTGQSAKAEPLFKKTLALSETDTEWFPHELLNAADFYRAWEKYGQAEALAQRALAIREKALTVDTGPDTQMNLAVCLNSLGAIYLAWNKPEKAEGDYRRSLDTLEKITDASQADLVPAVEGLASALHNQKKLEAAVPLYQRALEITEKSLGNNSLETAAVLEKYAELMLGMKKDKEAKIFLKRASAIRKQNARYPG